MYLYKYRVLLLLPLLLLCVAVLLLLLLLLTAGVRRVPAGSLNLIPVFSLYSFKHHVTPWQYCRIIYGLDLPTSSVITGKRGVKGGVSPPRRKPPLYPWYNNNVSTRFMIKNMMWLDWRELNINILSNPISHLVRVVTSSSIAQH